MLKRFTDERGLTPDTLASLSGVSKGMITVYVETKWLPTDTKDMEMVEKLADALEIDPDDFVEYRKWRLDQAMKKDPDKPVLIQEHRDAVREYETLPRLRRLRKR